MAISALRTQSESVEIGVPPVFCWTKMGTEAGQSLDDILKRKELERLAGKGSFCWGIGNSLGRAPRIAMQESSGAVPILFSPMKSSAKKLDEEPGEVALWTSYLDEHGEYVELPPHMVVTSRRRAPSGAVKTSHYALLCFSENSIVGSGNVGELDSSLAVNYVSKNALGASQVTAMVSYGVSNKEASVRPYPIKFEASFFKMGFVKLGHPVKLEKELMRTYQSLLKSKTAAQWRVGSQTLRALARGKFEGCISHERQNRLL